MPTYQYRCAGCEEQFDLWQSFSDDTLALCPSSDGPGCCTAPGEGVVRKVFASVGITFKGDGFYKNDYGSNSSGSTNSPKESDGGAKSEKSDKPAKSDKSDKPVKASTD